ncbi:MAG: GntR family transcriptional regulator [Rhodospirillaceae bacterium]|nr:GntR family transcriptional regulator [Rhodospirillaceae bacterium]
MQSAANKAYSHIRSRIIDGTLPSGAFLVEQDLAGEIGVSRTPVRDALNKLESEGLVASEGNKRAMVRDFSEDEVKECFELRAQFESYAAARAALRITPEAILKLKDLAGAMEAAVAKGGPEASLQFSDLNDQFHAVILEHGGSRRMRDLLNQLMQVQLVLMKRYRHTIEQHLQRSCWHHRELIAAFEARDAAWAETQMRTHMLSAKNTGDMHFRLAAE